MSKRLIVILALAFVVGISCAAYAEVQNVKISGDLLMSGVARNNFNLVKDVAGDKHRDNESFYMSQTRLRVDADLTDNVFATLRLINERDWEQESTTSTDIDLDLAYVTLKEFLFSPVTLTVGRQELQYGNSLIIRNSRNYAAGVITGVPSDLSLRTAFDAIKATLNYDPLVIDLFTAKIDENTNRGTTNAPQNDDRDLFGIYAKFDVDKKTSVDGYLFYRKDNNDADVAATDKADGLYTVGTLITLNPIEALKASVEAAMQFGHHRATNNERTYKAWALQPMLTYQFKGKYVPSLTMCYTYLSGDDHTDSVSQAWDSMYYGQALNNITGTILPFSNLSVLNLKGSIKPMEDVTLSANYGWYSLAKKTVLITNPSRDSDGVTYGNYNLSGLTKYLGSALDLTAKYDYTEDVQFSLTSGFFFPEKKTFYDINDANAASQVIGSMKVVF